MSGTTKQGKTAGGVKLTTSSPAGHEELSQHTAKEHKGSSEVPAAKARKKPIKPHGAEDPKSPNPKQPRTR